MYVDIDATLTEVHSENREGAAPTYKTGFGSHPLLCFADATGDALSALLRPGNAGSNTPWSSTLLSPPYPKRSQLATAQATTPPW